MYFRKLPVLATMGEEIRERLIEEVRIRPHIWNTKLKGFKDIKLKENSWMQIANLLNISGKFRDIKIQISNFSAHFSRRMSTFV